MASLAVLGALTVQDYHYAWKERCNITPSSRNQRYGDKGRSPLPLGLLRAEVNLCSSFLSAFHMSPGRELLSRIVDVLGCVSCCTERSTL